MNLFVRKPIDVLLREAENEGGKGLKRVLGPFALISLGVGVIIGAGLFSRWRYYNHWAYSGPDEKDKEWFLILLHRLKELY